MKKLERDFYNRDSITVAKELLGKILISKVGGKTLSAKIVETEAYMGITDKAAHSYGARRTQRVEVMYGNAGFVYVFIIYGMHNCFNVVTNEIDVPQAVLVRALEPLDGLDDMAESRFKKTYGELSKQQKISISNGPGKLCKAFAIDRSFNGEDLCKNQIYIADNKDYDFEIVTSKRIGIDYAEEAKDYPWRFYIKGNPYVSVK